MLLKTSTQKKKHTTPWTSSRSDTSPQPQGKTPGPCIRNVQETIGDKSSKRQKKKQRTTEKQLPSSHNQQLMTHKSRYMCPITGCHNFKGRGYARSTFIAHLNSHRNTFLVNESEKTKALQAASTFGNLGCYALCGKLNLSANGKRCCKKCSTL